MKQTLFILIFITMTYAYKGHPVQWEQVFSPGGITCLLVLGIAVGAPIIITLVILIPIWLLQYLGKWAAGLAKDITSKDEEENEE